MDVKYDRITEEDEQLEHVTSDDCTDAAQKEDTQLDTRRSSSSFSYGSSANDYLSNGGTTGHETSWWFQQPAIKRNKLVVLMAFLLVFIGIASFIGGIVSEVLFHSGMTDIIRGLVFFVASGLVTIPGVYAIVHMYLAAKKIGRVRFSSVWFFRE